MKRDVSSGSLASFYRDIPGLNLTDELADRILLDSTSGDTVSLHSAGTYITVSHTTHLSINYACVCVCLSFSKE